MVVKLVHIKNIITKKREGDSFKSRLKTTAPYNALIPSHTVTRSSCILGLELSELVGKTSVSRSIMHFLSKGCKGSKSSALLKRRKKNKLCEIMA